MARCLITKPKTLRRLSSMLGGKPIKTAMCRGGTDHRIDVVDEDGKKWHIWPDGDVTDDEHGDQPSIGPPASGPDPYQGMSLAEHESRWHARNHLKLKAVIAGWP